MAGSQPDFGKVFTASCHYFPKLRLKMPLCLSNVLTLIQNLKAMFFLVVAAVERPILPRVDKNGEIFFMDFTP